MSNTIKVSVSDPETQIKLQQLDKKLEEIRKNLPKPITELIDRKRLCDLLGVTVVTIIDWDKKGLTKPIKIGNRIRYKVSEVNELINKSRYES